MKVTTKLAKEIFSGDFTNVNLEELQKGSKSRERKFKYYRDLKDTYIKPDYIKLKHFKGLKYIEIVKCPNEEYHGRNRDTLMTDVLKLVKFKGSWYLDISREASKNFKKHVSFSFDEETKKEITENIIRTLEIEL